MIRSTGGFVFYENGDTVIINENEDETSYNAILMDYNGKIIASYPTFVLVQYAMDWAEKVHKREEDPADD